MKWLQTILPALFLAATIVAPQIQAAISAHPTIAALLAMVVAVANHITPSPTSTAAKGGS